MLGRSYTATTSYRYGFNGKEKASEITNGDYDYGMRIYDARIARWLSVDPLQKKYPSFSPYNYSVNNPVLYYDVDGKDVGVAITRNPQGGGTITFYSTTYVNGIDAAEKVKLYNAAFEKFIEANPGMKSSDGKWDVKIKMDFKVANADDINRITNNKQEMAAENLMNIESATSDSRAHSAMPVPGSSDKSEIKDVDPNGNSGMGLLLGTSPASGRFAQMYSNDGGTTAIHEEFHNWGIGDYYADVFYDFEVVNNSTGKSIQSGVTGKTPAPYAGFEGTIMGGGGLSMSKENLDDLVNMALKTSDVKKSDNFVMARKVDTNRPNGKHRVDQVPKVKTEKTKVTTTTYKNPRSPN